MTSLLAPYSNRTGMTVYEMPFTDKRDLVVPALGQEGVLVAANSDRVFKVFRLGENRVGIVSKNPHEKHNRELDGSKKTLRDITVYEWNRSTGLITELVPGLLLKNRNNQSDFEVAERAIKREIVLLKEGRIPYTVPFLGDVTYQGKSREKTAFVVEKLEGDLVTFSYRNRSKELGLRASLSVLEVLQGLEDNNLIHCDVKLDNLVFQREEERVRVYIIDLPDVRKASKDTPLHTWLLATGGTALYIAPEFFEFYRHFTQNPQDTQYDASVLHAIDRFAGGMIVYTLLRKMYSWTKDPLFELLKQTDEEVFSSKLGWKDLSPDVYPGSKPWQAICGLTRRNPSERMSLREASTLIQQELESIEHAPLSA